MDLFFENGVIFTADSRDSIAEALAVKDGKIVFVGSAEDGATYKEAAREVIDLESKMLMPGLIDGHIHSVTPEFYDFILTEATTLEDAMETIRDYTAANPNKETYYGGGYTVALFGGDELKYGPRKERLDEICPDKPLLIVSADGHSAWLNSKAFEYCGVTKNTESPPGGECAKREYDNQLRLLNHAVGPV